MVLKFEIKYHAEWGDTLALLLGDVKHFMTWTPGDIWTVEVKNCKQEDLEEYRYLVLRDSLIWRCEWGTHNVKPAKGTKTVTDSWIDNPSAGSCSVRKHSVEMFDRPGFRGAGVAVPVFSLRSERGFGIGEFLDLKELVDWAFEAGMKIIQLLPVNDTSRKGEWDDSYPYKPVSSFALNPLYINLQAVGTKEDAAFRSAKKELNAQKSIDYPKVYEQKTAYLIKAYDKQGAKDIKTSGFKDFCKANEFWLDQYAEFCSSRDGKDSDYYRWVQYHLDRQLYEVAQYARSKGVYLKGDLPIGVSKDSAEAYYYPELFNLDSCAGAPPDYFSADGQNWGFPTYNWDEMSKDDYAWWKARLRAMSRYFDAFRIDHILGYFRIWEIPAGEKTAVKGHFNPAMPYSADELSSMGLTPDEKLFVEDPRRKNHYHPLITPDTSGLDPQQKSVFDGLYWDFFFKRHNDFWWRSAERKLPELLGATGMLACGEDLGFVPDCVQSVMDHERILSLEMEMMDKGRPWPYLSVCATSSHDMPTLRMLRFDAEACDPSAEYVKAILNRHLLSDSMLAIFPLQDWLALDENLRREDFKNEWINNPADAHNHWCYRMHLNVDTLLAASSFTALIRQLISASTRL